MEMQANVHRTTVTAVIIHCVETKTDSKVKDTELFKIRDQDG